MSTREWHPTALVDKSIAFRMKRQREIFLIMNEW